MSSRRSRAPPERLSDVDPSFEKQASARRRARARGESALSGSAALLRSLRPQLKRALSASLGSGLEPDAVQKNDGAKKSEGGKKASDSTSGGVRAGARAPKQVDGGASSAGAKKGKAGGRLPLKHTDSRPSERFARPCRIPRSSRALSRSRTPRAPPRRRGSRPQGAAHVLRPAHRVATNGELSGESRDGSTGASVAQHAGEAMARSRRPAMRSLLTRRPRLVLARSARACASTPRAGDGWRSCEAHAGTSISWGGSTPIWRCERERARRLHPGTRGSFIMARPVHRGRRARRTMRWPSECTEIKLRRILSTTRSDCPSIVRCWRCVTLRHRSALATTPRPALPRRRARTAPQSPRIEASRRGHCAKAQTEARRRVV